MQTLEFTRAPTEIVAELKVRELYMLLQTWLAGPLPAQAPLPSVGWKELCKELNPVLKMRRNSDELRERLPVPWMGAIALTDTPRIPA